MQNAKSGVIAEGNVGGGTGMICHDFKGGIGTSSRLVHSESGDYVVGVLVQSNYGDRDLLRVNGVPVGQELGVDRVPDPGRLPPQSGSIIIVIATDAPLLSTQCKRLARRATVGLARVGSVGHNGSGDIFIAFSTGNDLPLSANAPVTLKMIPHHHMNPFFDAVAEATEEAILNSLTAAETMTGFEGNTVHALPPEDLQRVMAKYRGGT
jgi:D-aminopeptidase